MLKTLCSQDKIIQNLDHLRQEIVVDVADVEYRLDVREASNGAHNET